MKTPFHTPSKLEVSNGASTFYLRDERGDYIAKTCGDADKDAANASEIACRWNAHAKLQARNEELLGIVMRCLGFWEAPNPTFGCGAKRQAELAKIKSDARAAIARNEGIAHE